MPSEYKYGWIRPTMSGDDIYESVLLVIKEVHVYRIPPRTTSRGYRATEWDVNQFLWKGRLRIIARGDDAFINLEDSVNGELFAVCPYKLDGSTVEAVTDSSRYFVLTLTDAASGKKAFVGMGFPERSMAFDFNVALQDHAKLVKNDKDAAAKPKSTTGEPKVDYSLKEDQTIKINIGIGKPAARKKYESDGASTANILLPPPPQATAYSGNLQGSGPLSNEPQFNDTSDAFGDFVSAEAVDAAFSAASTASDQTSAAGWASFDDFNTSTAKPPEGWTSFD